MSEAIERLAAELGRVIAAATGRLSDEHRDDLPAVAAALMRDCGLVAVPADLAEAVRAGDAEGPLATPASLRARLALADAVLAQLGGGR